MKWVVNITPRPLYPLENPGTRRIEGWVGPTSGLDDFERSMFCELYSHVDRNV